MDIEEIYTEEILARYRTPKNKGKLENFDFHLKENNPLCGDFIEVFIKVKNGKVEDAKFIGEGCVISQVSTDLLLDFIKNKSLEEIKKINDDFLIKNIVKIPISYRRILCATLPLKALKKIFI
ncbi:MAG: iron-sulfur cluster assembly scaffold protein [Candidatus Aenigmarchaeota archaeon]|nr:iron-sulfur cluster assembly scaffold protein [Candidatus Aenigmarchaeota archaeon]MDW8149680.1 iron-sulfur cluster assembly scaffold protein [Candidatus Aenigmarchaeota archaeon]